MQGHDEVHLSGQEAAFVPFMVKLCTDLVRGGPVLGCKIHSLGEVLNYRRHGGLLKVSKLPRMSMRMVDKKMLEEEDGVKGRYELDGHQVLIGSHVLGVLASGGVSPQPLQE